MEFSLSFFGQASQEGAQSRVTEFIQKERTFQKREKRFIFTYPFLRYDLFVLSFY